MSTHPLNPPHYVQRGGNGIAEGVSTHRLRISDNFWMLSEKDFTNHPFYYSLITAMAFASINCWAPYRLSTDTNVIA